MFKHQINLSFAIVLILTLLPGINFAESRIDSTGTKVKEDGKVYITYKVEVNETWYALAKKFNVNLEELMAINENRPLKTDEVILIPTPLKSADLEKETGENKIEQERLPRAKKTPVYYKVKKGETLYSISKKFNKSIFALKEWNSFDTDEVKEADEIIVNYIVDFKEPNKLLTSSPKPITNQTLESDKLPEPDKSVKQIQTNLPFEPANELDSQDQEGDKKKSKKNKDKTKPLPPEIPSKLSKDELKKLEATRSVSEMKTDDNEKVIKKYVETGIGAYVSDVNLNQNRYYALHRTAPKGTIIKVTNSMNGSFTYVKVVGTLPDTGDNHNQIIKVSEAAAKKMGVLDTFFRVSLSYGVAAEE